ncbi:uncharacterized protein G2W53_034222 [Senna tora]|uniref:Uncharacterized protein n=1 Tax=Senna tora TaxID=362788 RepID=A0A834WBP7_9FABA|nr:uncharacterized protein G2W53_034222 [Senna tora]
MIAINVEASAVEVETDALEAIQLIEHADVFLHSFDTLAKMDSRHDTSLCIWEEPPREASLSLLADALSVAFLRD